MNIFLREKTNPNFDKPSEEDISQEIKANELRVGDTIITEGLGYFSTPK